MTHVDEPFPAPENTWYPHFSGADSARIAEFINPFPWRRARADPIATPAAR
jgi:hypothetical protein